MTSESMSIPTDAVNRTESNPSHGCWTQMGDKCYGYCAVCFEMIEIKRKEDGSIKTKHEHFNKDSMTSLKSKMVKKTAEVPFELPSKSNKRRPNYQEGQEAKQACEGVTYEGPIGEGPVGEDREPSFAEANEEEFENTVDYLTGSTMDTPL